MINGKIVVSSSHCFVPDGMAFYELVGWNNPFFVRGMAMKNIKAKAYLIVSVVVLTILSGNPVAMAEEPSDTSFSDGIVMPDSELSKQSGQGGGIASNAQVNNNAINLGSGASLVNGNNSIGDHALDNVNGIATVIQNSGNNVAIQNNILVNVNFQ